MISALLSRCLMLILGTLYPAYRSYKAIKNKDVREHVKWMMYWIVFGLFTTLETFLDIFFSWFPFYYEIKILFILWVLSPATRGSSLLYKKIVHPMLTSREKEIDELIEKTKSQGYNTFLQLFTSGFQYASNLFVSSAIKGQFLLGNQLKKSLSMNDVYDASNNFNQQQQQQQQQLKSNDLYKVPDPIHEEDDEDDDFPNSNDAEKIRLLNNKTYDKNLRLTSKKQSITELNYSLNRNNNNNNRDYEIVDDGILISDDSDAAKQLNTTGLMIGKRRASARQMTSISSSNYRTIDITRASGRRSKLNSVPTLNAQVIYDNDS